MALELAPAVNSKGSSNRKQVGYAYIKCEIFESINAEKYQAGFVGGLVTAFGGLFGRSWAEAAGMRSAERGVRNEERGA